MRVQRAPGAADQPQRAPVGLAVARRAAAPPTSSAEPSAGASAEATQDPPTTFFADTEMDLTRLVKRFDESEVVAEVVVGLVTAFRHEGLIDDATAVQVLRPTDQGMVGVRLAPAGHQSVYAISSGLKTMSGEPEAITSGTLTMVDLTGTRVHARGGDWGSGGLGVVTLGPIVKTVVSRRLTSSPGFSITERHIARLGFTAHRGTASACDIVRALDTLTRSMEGQTSDGVE